MHDMIDFTQILLTQIVTSCIQHKIKISFEKEIESLINKFASTINTGKVREL